MKILIDQQLPPALRRWLIEKGHEAIHVREIGLRDADDELIWAYALANGMVVITKDEDFASRRSLGSIGPGVIWLRVGNSTNRALFEWLDVRWLRAERALAEGAAIVELR